MNKASFHTLSILLEKYFHNWMTLNRNASENTLSSYSDAWQLFLLFLTDRKKCSLSKISLSDVNADNILEFLNYLENSRDISVSSRNQRLAAFRACSHKRIMRIFRRYFGNNKAKFRRHTGVWQGILTQLVTK